jgi:anti-sigma factor RsiW
MNRHRAGNGGWTGPGHGGAHNPEELGAHALGLLDPAQSRAVEEHLAGCPACRREWEELRGMVDLLDDVPPEAFLDGPPDADFMLQRTVRQIRAEAAARRGRRRDRRGTGRRGDDRETDRPTAPRGRGRAGRRTTGG